MNRYFSKVMLFAAILFSIIVLSFILGRPSVTNNTGSTDTGTTTTSGTTTINIWTWVSGSNTVNQTGTYGTKGVPDSSNVPGARQKGLSWVDSAGNFWLFGGDKSGAINDLWKYDGTNWTWVSGSNIVKQAGSYGTKGVPDASNVPGARYFCLGWIDSSDNLWLFGGVVYDILGNQGLTNDLWKYDGTNWTWISGSSTLNQSGTYGTKGVPDSSNIPGARDDSISWIDSSGNFWLFGGYGYDSAGILDRLNDLWKYDGTNWTWVSGNNTVRQAGNYGTKGVPDSSNIPSARFSSTGAADSSGNFWIFGGYGYDSAGNGGNINDLWKYEY